MALPFIVAWFRTQVPGNRDSQVMGSIPGNGANGGDTNRLIVHLFNIPRNDWDALGWYVPGNLHSSFSPSV